MSTATLTWWDSHVVGDTGTVTCSGAPGYISTLNNTFTATLNTGVTTADQCQYDFTVPSLGTASISFHANGTINVNIGGGGNSNGDTTWSEPVVLSYLRDGVTWHYNTGSMDYVDAPPVWDSFTVTWDGVEVDGIMPGSGGSGDGIYSENAFLKFDNITVPQGATINYAYVKFTSAVTIAGANGNDTVNAFIEGELVDDAISPTTGVDALNRARTLSSIAWESIEHWDVDETYDSPDLSCIVQEIVDRPGWSSGNSLQLFFSDYDSGAISTSFVYRESYDYLDDSSKAAQLFIYYSVEEFGSGGAVMAGSCQPSGTITATVSGGALANGSSTNSLIINDQLTANGLLAAGASFNSVDSDASSAYGVKANGTSTVTEIYNLLLTAYGLNIAGSADVSLIKETIITANGLLANGNALDTRIRLVIASLDGPLLSGSATITQSYSNVASSGILANGVADNTENYQVPINAAGCIVYGSANYGIFINDTIVANGVISSGNALDKEYYFYIVDPSGLEINGDADIYQAFNVSGINGAYLAGSSGVTSFVNEPVNGTAQSCLYLAGSAKVTQPVRHFTSTGDVVVLGSTTTSVPIGFHPNYITTGSQVIMGGESEVVYGIKATSTGGITISSNTGLKATYRKIGRGTITIGGSSKVKLGAYSYNPQPTSAESISIGGKSTCRLIIPCAKPTIGCNVIKRGTVGDCPQVDFYYADSLNNRPNAPRGSGAYLPAITKCRQTLPFNRRRSPVGTTSPFKS